MRALSTFLFAPVPGAGPSGCRRPRMRRSLVAVVLAGMVLSACSDGAGPTDDAVADDPAAADDAATDAAAQPVAYDPNAALPEGFEARDPSLPPAPTGDVHEIELRASSFEAHVGGGAVQQLWGFDEQVPGPTLRAKVGDTFIVTFVNDADMSHSIDFHASNVAPNVQMRTIPPGESLTYEFEAKHAGIWMYHCGKAPVLLHAGNGQYGAVVVDPPDLPEGDHEYVFVQSEFYLGAD